MTWVVTETCLDPELFTSVDAAPHQMQFRLIAARPGTVTAGAGSAVTRDPSDQNPVRDQAMADGADRRRSLLQSHTHDGRTTSPPRGTHVRIRLLWWNSTPGLWGKHSPGVTVFCTPPALRPPVCRRQVPTRTAYRGARVGSGHTDTSCSSRGMIASSGSSTTGGISKPSA